MKEDNKRRGQALLCPIPPVHFPPKIASEGARGIIRRNVFHQDTPPPQIFSINARPRLPSSVFHQPFITLVTRICFSPSFLPSFLPSALSRRALTRETRARRVPPPSGFINPTVKTRPTMGISGTVSGFHRVESSNSRTMIAVRGN